MKAMDIAGIMRYLPHRYPFLLIDRVLTMKPGESLTCVKNVTFNEPFFQGHFPQRPIMPGVLILEALAQATGVLALAASEQLPDHQSMYYLVGIDSARFKQPVEPGDQLLLEVVLEKMRQDVGRFRGEARVDGKLAAAATLLCAKRRIDL